MAHGPVADDAEDDWRLHGELRMQSSHGSLHALVDRIREHPFEQLRSSLPHDVVLTHDGNALFAYAADKATIEQARSAIEAVLSHEGIAAQLQLTHWDRSCDEWVRPGAGGSEGAAAAGATESRTMVASAGRLVQAEFEQTMLDWAARLGLQCKIVEHPHTLSTQVAFTVTGSRRKIDEFASGLAAEGRAMIRTETAVMLSPL
jgi:hypothetical protein